ncbi:hypothetical protein [Kribbella jiaozuonensis]|uniref:Uncharacterized protein n=1 Tax=Kribbella jiaozuonensis TaxID=2575441 RepID=A0A4V5UY63_9ACTN|nr:hypothetical protein [Kribbella jiaozuonensis]TKK75323.1 hypothetical protein FDA38_33480 [Kribbella jiaozuonensis]
MPAYCTSCGTRRAEGDEVCSHCEAAFKDTDETRSADGPPGHGTSWFVGLTMVLAVVVTGGILGIDAMIGRATAAASDQVLQNQWLTPDGYITSGPKPAEETPSDSWVPPATEDETSEPVPIETTPTPEVGNELIAVDPAAAEEPAAADVVRLLTSYFTAINDHDYDSYQVLLTPAALATQTRKQFTNGFRSTVDSEITLLGLSTATDGRLLAQVSFVSRQNGIDGPDGQTCTRWTVGKFLEGQGTDLLIGKALSGHASHTAC